MAFRDSGRGGFSRDRSSGRFGGHSGGRDRDFRRERPQMFEAVCSKCGKDCQVPFRPTGSKPVLCNDCFGKESPRESRSFGSSAGITPEQFNQINVKLDKILAVLETLEIISEDEEPIDEEAEE